MKYRIVTFLTCIGFLLLSGYLILGIVQSKKQQRNLEASYQQLPSLPITLLSGDTMLLAAKPPKPSVVIFFNSGCEHCQYEASEIQKHSTQLARANLYLISEESLGLIGKFAEKYGLLTLPNVQCSQVSSEAVHQHFGVVGIPSVYIYDANGTLTKKYNGETKIEAILSHLPH